jgi:hypothetical protein
MDLSRHLELCRQDTPLYPHIYAPHLLPGLRKAVVHLVMVGFVAYRQQHRKVQLTIQHLQVEASATFD